MVGYVLQPLDDERSRDAEGEIPDDVEVWWVCGAAPKRYTSCNSQGKASGQLGKCTSPTFVPLFRDISGESSVHSVGEDVAVNYPDPPRRRFRQQLQDRDIKRRHVQTPTVVQTGKQTPSELLSLPSALE